MEARVTVPAVTRATGSSLQRLAEQAWERTAAASALYFEGTWWTGLELAERARRMSGGLRGAGLAAGERVVVCMANCPEVGIAYQAVWRAGAVATPVLFLLSETELRHVLTDSGAAFVVTTPEFLAKVQAAAAGTAVRAIIVSGAPPASNGGAGSSGANGGGLPLLDFAVLETAAEGPLADADPDSLAALLYTGGTTGRSKGVMISHNALSASSWAATHSSYDPALRTGLLPLPLSHVYGLMVSAMALHAPDAGTTVLMRWFDPAGWLKLAAEHQVQVSPVVPSMLAILLQQPLEDYDLSALRRVTSGGAPLPPEVGAEFQRRVPGVEVAEGYGCTESAAIISTSPVGQARPGSVGKPAPGVTMRIERPDGTEAGPGEDGEVCVRGAMIMTGYWHAGPETAHTLRGDWLHTGDVGRLDADGYLYIVDRIKDLIIRGGYNIYPRDLEDAMVTHPDVVAAAVVGRPDPTYGEEAVAFVQLRPGATVTEADLIAYGKERLSAVKYPREVRIIDEVPLTSVFKTDRKKLRALLADGAAGTATPAS
jgi:long-chain acyl-CoA synthetase